MESEQKPKISLNTKANLLAIASVTIVPIWWLIVSIIWANQKIGNAFYVLYSGRICGITAILCGILSLIFAKRIKGSSWSKPIAILGCILAIIYSVSIPHILSDSFDAKNDNCHMNLWVLSTSIKAYCEKHNGEFPDPAKWCDLLLSESQKSDDKNGAYWKLSEKNFKCRANLEGRYVYAFNKDLAGKRISEVDPNVVVIFEANTVGWNQNGGSELMCPDLHKIILGETGSYVLCPDQYDVRFVPQSEVKNLRWNP